MKTVLITKDKKHIKIKDMTTSHIKNCINILDKCEVNRIDNMYGFLGSLSGEMAQMSMENEIANAEENGFNDIDEYRTSFEEELKKRGER